RDLAIEQKLPFLTYLLKQFCIILLIAAFLGIILTAATFWWYNEARLSMVLGISLVAAVISSVLTGLLIPYAFSRLNMDPANASGPTATIIQDLLSVFIYFTIATLLL
ncbi:magnesium transporter, partial [Candidatus Peregrinibacteria bacterium]|nr:magnesium transporter [Candidatus Peregrinibacteria bacterium]